MTESTKQVLSPVQDHPDLYLFWCPGCKCAHFIDQRWTLQGSLECPTVTRSVLVHGSRNRANNPDGQLRCHLFIRGGKLVFLNDCEHALAGQTVEMTPI